METFIIIISQNFLGKLNSRSNAFTAVIPGTNYCVRVCCICVCVCVCVSEQAYRVFSTLLYYALQLLYFHKLKFCDNPVKKSIGIAFPTALGHFVSLFHTLVTLAIFKLFHYCVCYGDMLSVIFDVAIAKRL